MYLNCTYKKLLDAKIKACFSLITQEIQPFSKNSKNVYKGIFDLITPSPKLSQILKFEVKTIRGQNFSFVEYSSNKVNLPPPPKIGLLKQVLVTKNYS